MKKRIFRKDHGGFTLIELSIVLVIIGLIVGGVLTGRDLIKAAEVRATVTQVEKFQTAANTFYGKYGFLPGDIKDPAASSFGFAPRGPYAGEGDGNGLIQGLNFSVPNNAYGWQNQAGETIMFWSDLTYANGHNLNLIEGTFSAASPTAGASATGSALINYFPAAKLGGGNYFYIYSNSGPSGPGDSINYFGLSVATDLLIDSTPGLTVSQAYAIDKKMDDGLPASGRVIAAYIDENSNNGGARTAPNAASPSNVTCYDTTSQKYSVTQNGGANVNCALSFRLQ